MEDNEKTCIAVIAVGILIIYMISKYLSDVNKANHVIREGMTNSSDKEDDDKKDDKKDDANKDSDSSQDPGELVRTSGKDVSCPTPKVWHDSFKKLKSDKETYKKDLCNVHQYAYWKLMNLLSAVSKGTPANDPCAPVNSENYSTWAQNVRDLTDIIGACDNAIDYLKSDAAFTGCGEGTPSNIAKSSGSHLAM